MTTMCNSNNTFKTQGGTTHALVQFTADIKAMYTGIQSSIGKRESFIANNDFSRIEIRYCN